jgi:pimeloyl-ACP methyl ester carboxylesterase
MGAYWVAYHAKNRGKDGTRWTQKVSTAAKTRDEFYLGIMNVNGREVPVCYIEGSGSLTDWGANITAMIIGWNAVARDISSQLNQYRPFQKFKGEEIVVVGYSRGAAIASALTALGTSNIGACVTIGHPGGGAGSTREAYCVDISSKNDPVDKFAWYGQESFHENEDFYTGGFWTAHTSYEFGKDKTTWVRESWWRWTKQVEKASGYATYGNKNYVSQFLAVRF